jgi:hypothetical protein
MPAALHKRSSSTGSPLANKIASITEAVSFIFKYHHAFQLKAAKFRILVLLKAFCAVC